MEFLEARKEGKYVDIGSLSYEERINRRFYLNNFKNLI